MAWRIVKQPNGFYARWSDIVDAFTHLNHSREQIVQLCLSEGLGEAGAEQKVQRAEEDPNRWNEAIQIMKTLGKTAALATAQAADRVNEE